MKASASTTLCVVTLLCTAGVALPASADPIALVNASFEANWTGTGDPGYPLFLPGYAASPTGPDVGWTFDARPDGTPTTGAAGVTDSNTLWGGTAYDGQRFAWLQNGDPTNPFSSDASNFQQSFTVTRAGQVDVVFELARRVLYSSGNPAAVAVAIDGRIVSTVSTPNSNWVEETVSLGTLTAGSHVLGFAGVMPGSEGDTSAFIDSVALNPVPEPGTANLAIIGLIAFGAKALYVRRSRDRA
jgi:hypothetical protein